MGEHTFSIHRPHPWHGLTAGPEPPRRVHCYVEITPFDTLKYEVDKESGYLRLDRPQVGSSTPPAPYGFIPRTYCGPRVAAFAPESGRGDGDPLDVCVFSERPINRAEVLLTARTVGGIRTTDRDEADDKILAVLANDLVWGEVRDVAELPLALVDRLRHYFGTYKMRGPATPSSVVVHEVYGRERAEAVVEAAIADYLELFGKER
jgi:inorganic pyrophosphatase